MDLRDKDQVVRFEGDVVLNVKLPQSAARRPQMRERVRDARVQIFGHLSGPSRRVCGLRLSLPAGAQQGNNVPNALQGFAKNRDKPVRIEAASLEVRERDKAAVFAGNVMVQQGDTTMRSKQLVVHYDLDAGKGEGKGQPQSDQAQAQARPKAAQPAAKAGGEVGGAAADQAAGGHRRGDRVDPASRPPPATPACSRWRPTP